MVAFHVVVLLRRTRSSSGYAASLYVVSVDVWRPDVLLSLS